MAQRTRRAVELAVEMRPTDQVKPYEANPRQNDQAVEAVANSIREFGFRQPIVVDADGVIIVGHTRWKAAKALGLEKVPVHVARDLTPEQVRAYRLADNATADLADWDYELLSIELAAIIPEFQNIDWSSLGFSADVLRQASISETTPCEGAAAPSSESTTAPQPNVIVRLCINPDTWLVHSAEIKSELDALGKKWRCQIDIRE